MSILKDSRFNRAAIFRRSNVVWSSLLVLIAVIACRPIPPLGHRLPPGAGPIHGYVFATVDGDISDRSSLALRAGGMAIPDIVVVAKNVGSGATSAPVKSDPYGYFRTPPVPEGRYQICVSGVGFASSCDSEVISITTQKHVMDHIVIAHASRSAVVGVVQLADKVTPCFWYDPTFDANFVMTARVTLVDGSGTIAAGPIRGNNLGQYLLPVAAPPGNYGVKVDCESSRAALAITTTGATLARDFVLDNHPPAANLLQATKAGVGVRRASPGDALTISVSADDVDHDALHYKWVDDSGGTATFADAPTVNWSAPAPGGVKSLRVLVSDGHGGYAVSRTQINVGADAVHFSGVAFNRLTHAPVVAAEVKLNGIAVTTDATGHFQLDVPDATRFVMNAVKPGFALTSRIFYIRAVGIQLPMDEAQSVTVNMATGGKIGVRVSGCAIKEERSTAPDRAERCEREALGTLQFAFEPHSLVRNTQAFNGVATVEAFQFDLAQPNSIPGDQSATFKGASARLETFGAFHIAPRDAEGHVLQMAPGKSVAVSMPIHPLALATAPAKIPFFSYDEASGLWIEHGVLKRVGNNYIGKITHFSEFNADTIGNGSSCMSIQLEQGPQGFPASVIMNATYVNASVGNFNHPNTVITDTLDPIVIERLVPNQDFYLEIQDNSSHNILQRVLLNSGPAPATPLPFPVPTPYADCKPAVVFNNKSVPPTSDHFLIFGTIPDNSADYKTQTTTGLYTGRATFAGWLSANGFGGGATEVSAVYFNNGDLKFGRSMHCRSVTKHGGFTADYIACYVSNFGSVGLDFDDQPANPLQEAYANTPITATVAMEFHPDQTDKVQFWAFKGNGDYLPAPALDVEGPKPMPDICMGCHQGTGGGGGSLVQSAVFLPFDIDSFLGDDGQPLQGTIGKGAQRPTQEAFRQLNAFVLASTNDINTQAANGAVQKLMDLWYKDATHAGVNTAGATYHFNQGAAVLNANTPNSWPTNQALYDDVVRPVCRTCHVAAPYNDGNLTWDTLSKMTTAKTDIQNNACGPGNTAPHHEMPHAQVPYKRFWEDNLETTLASELSITCSP
jgi:hypothetical protein